VIKKGVSKKRIFVDKTQKIRELASRDAVQKDGSTVTKEGSGVNVTEERMKGKRTYLERSGEGQLKGKCLVQ